jgi:hypothetical protein
MAAKKRVFISFDYDHDEGTKNMLSGQAKLPDSLFDFKDASVKEPLTGDWKAKVGRRMDEYTNKASGVAAELATTQEKDKAYFLLKAYADKKCVKPTTAKQSDNMYNWTWPNLKTLIGGGEIRKYE